MSYRRRGVWGIVYLIAVALLIGGTAVPEVVRNPGELVLRGVFVTLLLALPGILLVVSAVRGERRTRAVLASVNGVLERYPDLLGGALVRSAAAETHLEERTVRKVLVRAEEEGRVSVPGSTSAPVVEGPPSEETRWLWDRLREYAIPFPSLTLGSEISARSLEKTGGALASLGPDEVPLALVRTGKEGLLITDRNVRWRLGDEDGACTFEDLPEVVPLTDSWLRKGFRLQGMVELPVAPGAPEPALERLAAFLNRARAKARRETDVVPAADRTMEATVAPEEAPPGPGKSSGRMQVESGSERPSEGGPGFRPCLVRDGVVYCDCPACGNPGSWPLVLFSPRSRTSSPGLRRTGRVFPYGRPIVGMAAAFILAAVVGMTVAGVQGRVTTWAAIVAAAAYMGLRPVMVRALMPRLPVWEVTCGSCDARFGLAVKESTAVSLEELPGSTAEVRDEPGGLRRASGT